MTPLRVLRASACSLLPFLVLVSAPAASAQIVTHSDLPEKPRLEIDPNVENGRTLSWFGREGFSYFVQTTTDLVAEPWQYLPLIETGHDAELHYGLVTTAPRFFARVVLSEQTAADPLTADFDGDGISNIDELNRLLDPVTSRDDDGDGHPDDWERYYFNNSTTTTNDAFADQDTDGLSDFEEAMRGTDPQLADTDGDGVVDGEDGWPRHPWITQAPLPEVRYAVVPLTDCGFPPAYYYPDEIDDSLGILAISTVDGLNHYWHMEDGLMHATGLSRDYAITRGSATHSYLSPSGVVMGQTYSDEGTLGGTWKRGRDEDNTPLLVNRPDPEYRNLMVTAFTSDNRLLGQARHLSSSQPETISQGGWDFSTDQWIDDSYALLGASPFRQGILLDPTAGNSTGIIGVIRWGPEVPYWNGSTPERAGVWENGVFTDLSNGSIFAVTDTSLVLVYGYAREPSSARSFVWWGAKESTGWETETLKVWNSETRQEEPMLVDNPYARNRIVNNRYEIINTAKIVRNGISQALGELIESSWSGPQARAINNHGVILATATRTIDAAGQPIPPANQVTEPVLLVPYYLAQAEGENAGKPLLHGAAVYEPDDGVGRGPPIYHPVKNNLSLSFPTSISSSTIDTLHCLLWDEALSLTETSASSGVFQTVTADLIVTLPDLPLLDGSVLEHLTAVVHSPARALHNAAYSLEETTATSNQFEDRTVFASVQIGALSDQTVDEVQLRLTDDLRHADITLMETAPGSGVFAKDGTTLSLAAAQTGAAPTAAQLAFTVSAGAFALSNTTLVLDAGPGGDGEYRNASPPTPTNTPPSTAPAHAKWKLKIALPPDVATVLGLKWATAEGERPLSFAAAPADSLGYSTSANAFIVVPHTVTAPLIEGAQTLAVRTQELDWQATVGDLKLVLGAIGGSPVAAAEKAQPQGVALQSLDPGTRALQSIDTNGRVKVPFEQMGYSMTMDLKASAQKTLAEYAKGKQIWYSLSHGATEHGEEQEPFLGLNFLDGSITADKLRPLNLSYRLAIVDGCLSAQTTFETENVAKTDETLEFNCVQFARTFGPRAAYVGWAWSMNPGAAQVYSAQLIQFAKDTPNIGAAHAQYRKRLPREDAKGGLLKLHEVSPGARNNPINLTRP